MVLSYLGGTRNRVFKIGTATKFIEVQVRARAGAPHNPKIAFLLFQKNTLDWACYNGSKLLLVVYLPAVFSRFSVFHFQDSVFLRFIVTGLRSVLGTPAYDGVTAVLGTG